MHVWEADGKHCGLGLIMSLAITSPAVSAGGQGTALLDHTLTLAISRISQKSPQKESQRHEEGGGGGPISPHPLKVAPSYSHPPAFQDNIQTKEIMFKEGAAQSAAFSWGSKKADFSKSFCRRKQRDFSKPRRRLELGNSRIIGKPPTTLIPNFQML